MGVMNCADKTGDKNLAIMADHLNKLPATGSDVLCVFREEG